MAISAAQNSVVTSVDDDGIGKAAGANSMMRELGGVFGIAVLAAVFANQGGYGPPEQFIDGLKPAMWIGAIVVGIGALLCLLIPGKQPAIEGAAQGDWSGGGQGEWQGAADASTPSDA